jgi:hypothetical protein
LNPIRVAYDSNEGLLRLFAANGALLGKCVVSKAAYGWRTTHWAALDAMISTYHRSRDHIHAIAQHKYRHADLSLWERGHPSGKCGYSGSGRLEAQGDAALSTPFQA